MFEIKYFDIAFEKDCFSKSDLWPQKAKEKLFHYQHALQGLQTASLRIPGKRFQGLEKAPTFCNAQIRKPAENLRSKNGGLFAGVRELSEVDEVLPFEVSRGEVGHPTPPMTPNRPSWKQLNRRLLPLDSLLTRSQIRQEPEMSYKRSNMHVRGCDLKHSQEVLCITHLSCIIHMMNIHAE